MLIPRNHREGNRRTKAGKLPQDGRGAKRAQKDVDGHWTRKRGNHSFGNKNHISIDAEHKIIRRFQTTPARAHEGQCNQPLTNEQQANNRTRSKIRSRVEHVFDFQENSMGRKFIRTIGLARAKVKIALMNLTCNLIRYRQLTKDRAGAPATARSDQREAEQAAGQHELQGIVHIDLLMRHQHIGISATFHKSRRRTGFFKVPINGF